MTLSSFHRPQSSNLRPSCGSCPCPSQAPDPSWYDEREISKDGLDVCPDVYKNVDIADDVNLREILSSLRVQQALSSHSPGAELHLLGPALVS